MPVVGRLLPSFTVCVTVSGLSVVVWLSLLGLSLLLGKPPIVTSQSHHSFIVVPNALPTACLPVVASERYDSSLPPLFICISVLSSHTVLPHPPLGLVFCPHALSFSCHPSVITLISWHITVLSAHASQSRWTPRLRSVIVLPCLLGRCPTPWEM